MRMKTTFPKNNCHIPHWYVIDASKKTLGRLSSEISVILRGKKNSYFYPIVDQGNFVLVINSNQIKISGKKEYQKKYYNSTKKPGHLKYSLFKDLRKVYSTRIIERAVKRMLPKGFLGKKYLKRLFLFQNSEILYKLKK